MVALRRRRPLFYVHAVRIHPQIEITADGSPTLRHPLLGETYHSLNGAVSESEHIFLRGGFDACTANPVSILEVGFGSGLNAYLTLRAGADAGRQVHYTAVELYPVDAQTVASLDWARDALFTALHSAPWGRDCRIADHFTLHKIEGDFADTEFDTTFDLVYFDAFAPDTQPELWSGAVFGKIFASLSPGGSLVTYSAKGDVKRALRGAGFEVRRLPGAPGKRHMLRAIKTVEL